MTKPASTADNRAVKKEDEREFCGLVMPISPTPTYPESHWGDVRAILDEVIDQAGFNPRLVSESDDAGVIHGRIVQNLYDYPVAVIDVSSRNPNVMFEFGMRLAFDKPVVVVKDTSTDFSFDTAPIEHLPYPKDLRWGEIEEFKKRLKEKILHTYESSKKPEYRSFLDHFKRVKITHIKEQNMTASEYLTDAIDRLTKRIDRLDRKSSPPFSGQGFSPVKFARRGLLNVDGLHSPAVEYISWTLMLSTYSDFKQEELLDFVRSRDDVYQARFHKKGGIPFLDVDLLLKGTLQSLIIDINVQFPQLEVEIVES